MSSAARPMRATRASHFVPVRLMPRAITSRPSVSHRVVSAVCSMPNRLAAKPEPYSDTAVIVTIIAQM